MLDPKRSLARTLAAVRIPGKKRFPGPMPARAHKGYEGTKKKDGMPMHDRQSTELGEGNAKKKKVKTRIQRKD